MAYFGKQVSEKLHQKEEVSVLLLLRLLVHRPPAHLPLRVGPDQSQRVLVKEPALSRSEITQNSFGSLTIEFKYELNDDTVMMIESQQMNQGGKSGFEPTKHLK